MLICENCQRRGDESAAILTYHAGPDARQRFEADFWRLRLRFWVLCRCLFLPTLQAIGVTDLIVADALRPNRVANAGAIPEDGSLSLGEQEYTVLAANLRELAFIALLTHVQKL